MNQRIQATAQAAARLFIQQGYARTQISHIARAVGVSVGTIYLDFAGKKEIMHFILKCMVDPAFAEREFERPITDELFVGLEEEIKELFERLEQEFARHLQDSAAGCTFEGLISDTFDLFSRYAVGCLFIERNQAEFKDLAALYTAYRTRFLDMMARYMEQLVQRGAVRPLEQLELSTTLIVEMLSWWAMDIRYNTFETKNISADLAKQVCLDNLIAAYRR